jgi:hypothetical protein
MPFELNTPVIYRIQNVLYPASYLSVGRDDNVVCAEDDITDIKQQVRRFQSIGLYY